MTPSTLMKWTATVEPTVTWHGTLMKNSDGYLQLDVWLAGKAYALRPSNTTILLDTPANKAKLIHRARGAIITAGFTNVIEERAKDNDL